MLDQRYYAITIFSNEWWINNIITCFFICLFLYIGKVLYKNKTHTGYFSFIIGILLLLRLIWNQWYQYNIGQWNIEWSLPIQLCSFSSILSGILPIAYFINTKENTKQTLYEFLLYWGIAGFYAFITPVYTSGIEGFIYYDYYLAHGGFIFIILYFTFIHGYRPRKKSWLYVFLYSQILLLVIHLINNYIGGSANYFYTIEPPIANNPLVIGVYPTHIIFMDLFALIHFYIFCKLLNYKRIR